MLVLVKDNKIIIQDKDKNFIVENDYELENNN